MSSFETYEEDDYHSEEQIQSVGPLDLINGIRREVVNAVIGQDVVIDQVLAAFLAGGHVLIEGVPGLGKTLLVKALARTFSGDFSLPATRVVRKNDWSS